MTIHAVRIRILTILTAMGLAISLCSNSAVAQRIAQSRVHYAGEIWLNVTSFGSLGSGPFGDNNLTRFRMPAPMEDLNHLRVSWQPSFTFPGPTGQDFLYMGGLMVGCVRGIDTLVSTTDQGAPGYSREFVSVTGIRESTTHRGSPHYDPRALADQEYYTVYTDTFPGQLFELDEIERVPHRPIGIEVHQTSRAWTTEVARRFIIIDNWIVNVSGEPLRNVCIGLRLDPNVIHQDFSGQDRSDDICGYIEQVEGPTAASWEPKIYEDLNLAWVIDNDGDPENGNFTPYSPVGGVGVRMLRVPPGTRPSFNWWNVSFTSSALNWGPRLLRDAGGHAGSTGRPIGDRGLYHLMTNGEVDYGQLYSSIDYSPDGWAAPPQLRALTDLLAGGGDINMMFSVGPLPTLLPGDSLPFTYALIAGKDVHVNATNYNSNFVPSNPQRFIEGLDFGDLITNARWADWLFDVPGEDTDGNGTKGLQHTYNCRFFRGARICQNSWYKGDGVPDWDVPGAPNPPVFETSTRPSEVVIRWTGANTELEPDPLSGRPDFEGYRVYIANRDFADEYSLLSSWDVDDNFIRYDFFPQFQDRWRGTSASEWRRVSHPHTVDEWKVLMDDPNFDPRDYLDQSFNSALVDTVADTIRNPFGQIIRIEQREAFSYWIPAGGNNGNQYWNGTEYETNIIQKIDSRDTIINEDTLSYGIYEATITNLNVSQPVYVAVTAFDHGDFERELSPQESPPQANNKFVHLIYSADVVVDSGLKVSVYPNPYKAQFRDGMGQWTNYYAQGHEAPNEPQWTETDRRIWFVNLPDKAHIEIYSLDGDLIRVIDHPDPFLSRYESSVGWDLVSRNQQAVESGIYIYRVDSELGTIIGKIVIIK